MSGSRGVKGRGHGSYRQRPVDDAVEGDRLRNLDLLPSDFSYRNIDLELETEKRTRRLDQLLSGVADTTTRLPRMPAQRVVVSENVLRAADVLLVRSSPDAVMRTYAR